MAALLVEEVVILIIGDKAYRLCEHIYDDTSNFKPEDISFNGPIIDKNSYTNSRQSIISDYQ